MTATFASLEAWPLATLIRTSTWGYPLLEIVHIASFAALVGSLLTLELRVFGLQPAIPLWALGRLAVRVALTGFLLAAASGALMLLSRATELATHPAFLAKLGFLGLAGLNAAVFHVRDGLRRHDGVARLQAALSLVLWFAVIAAGRLIGYI